MKYALLDKTDIELLEDIYEILKRFEGEYPNIFNWYYSKVLPKLGKGRDIIVCIDDGRLVGVCILKHLESKICTLYVVEEYRGRGVGSKLLELACKTLKVAKPFVTVSNMYLDYYLKLFFGRNFKLVKTYRNYYTKDKVEYSFNGYLSKDKT